MGIFRWRNDSSFVVEWVVISPLGSVSGRLEPGGDYARDVDTDVTQVGIHCPEAPVYVIRDLAALEAASLLVAADVIPMGAMDESAAHTERSGSAGARVLSEGTSARGNLTEAIDEAVQAAKERLRSSFVHWRLLDVDGDYGGVANARKLRVTIAARRPGE